MVSPSHIDRYMEILFDYLIFVRFLTEPSFFVGFPELFNQVKLVIFCFFAEFFVRQQPRLFFLRKASYGSSRLIAHA